MNLNNILVYLNSPTPIYSDDYWKKTVTDDKTTYLKN